MSTKLRSGSKILRCARAQNLCGLNEGLLKGTQESSSKMFKLFTSWAKLRSLKISFFSFFFIALLKSSDINGFDHISSQNWWFTSKMWYDNILIRNFIRFPDIFPDFSQILRFQWFWPYFYTELMVYFSNMIW